MNSVSSKDPKMKAKRNTFQLQNLPHCAIFKVFSYLTYNQVAQMRIISKRLNKLCQEYLNHGVKSLLVNLEKRINQVNSMLPKRKSLKDSHHLSDHSQMLQSLKYNIECVLDYQMTNFFKAKMISFAWSKKKIKKENILVLILDTTIISLQNEKHQHSAIAIELFLEIDHFLRLLKNDGQFEPPSNSLRKTHDSIFCISAAHINIGPFKFVFLNHLRFAALNLNNASPCY